MRKAVGPETGASLACGRPKPTTNHLIGGISLLKFQHSYSNSSPSKDSSDFATSERSSLKRPLSAMQERGRLSTTKTAYFSTSSESESESESDSINRNNYASFSMNKTSKYKVVLPARNPSKQPRRTTRQDSGSNIDSVKDEFGGVGQARRQAVDSEHLTETLQIVKVKQELHLQNPGYFAEEDVSDSGGDLDGKYEAESESDYTPPDEFSTSNSVSDKSASPPPEYMSPAQKKRLESRTITTPKKGIVKMPSRPASKLQVVINLVSDDESEGEIIARKAAKSATKQTFRPAPSVYVPVDNSGLAADAQTNRYINHDNSQARKHGPRT